MALETVQHDNITENLFSQSTTLLRILFKGNLKLSNPSIFSLSHIAEHQKDVDEC